MGVRVKLTHARIKDGLAQGRGRLDEQIARKQKRCQQRPEGPLNIRLKGTTQEMSKDCHQIRKAMGKPKEGRMKGGKGCKKERVEEREQGTIQGHRQIKNN